MTKYLITLAALVALALPASASASTGDTQDCGAPAAVSTPEGSAHVKVWRIKGDPLRCPALVRAAKAGAREMWPSRYSDTSGRRWRILWHEWHRNGDFGAQYRTRSWNVITVRFWTD